MNFLYGMLWIAVNIGFWRLFAKIVGDYIDKHPGPSYCNFEILHWI
jgi:hypothetical protein